LNSLDCISEGKLIFSQQVLTGGEMDRGEVMGNCFPRNIQALQGMIYWIYAVNSLC